MAAHNFKDETNNRFGRLVAIKRLPQFTKPAKWLCDCDCGNQVSVLGVTLRSGHTRSCGCLASEMTSKRNRSNKKYTRKERILRAIRRDMIRRCYELNNVSYPHYGGRGIKVCNRWKKSLQYFIEDMGSPPTPNHSLDRIDNNGHYEPSNCKWATIIEQRNNNRRNRLITYKGKTQTMTQWANEVGILYSRLRYRINNNWPIEEALYAPRFSCKHRFK